MWPKNNPVVATKLFILVVCSLFAPCSGFLKGLTYLRVTMGGGEGGTNDNVRVQLSEGKNGQTCTTKAIYTGGFVDSWSPTDTEVYRSDGQDFGDCTEFEVSESNVSFNILKDGTDGLVLTTVKFVIGNQTYLWSGHAEWDPNHLPVTAICTNCRPVNCVVSGWSKWSSCTLNCTSTRSRAVTQIEKFGGICPKKEELEQKNNTCTGYIPGTNQTCPRTPIADDSGHGGATPTKGGPAGPIIAAVLVFLVVCVICFILYNRWKKKKKKVDYSWAEGAYEMGPIHSEPSIVVVKKDEPILKNNRANLEKIAGKNDKLNHNEKRVNDMTKKYTNEMWGPTNKTERNEKYSKEEKKSSNTIAEISKTKVKENEKNSHSKIMLRKNKRRAPQPPKDQLKQNKEVTENNNRGQTDVKNNDQPTDGFVKRKNIDLDKNNVNQESNSLLDKKPVVHHDKLIGKVSIPAAFGGSATSSLLPAPTEAVPRRSSFSHFPTSDPPLVVNLSPIADLRRHSFSPIIQSVKAEDHDQNFITFANSEDMMEILNTFETLYKTASVRPGPFNEFFSKFSVEFIAKIPHRYIELFQALQEKARGKEYMANKAAEGKRVLVIGGGPAGLRMAIETQLLGARTILLEKRTSINRNNVVKLWTFAMEDLKVLGAKKLYPALGNGSVNHVSIRILQLILLKMALLLGTEVRSEATYTRIVEPGDDRGWRVITSRQGEDNREEEFDIVIGATGRSVLLEGFGRKSLDAKLAIAITANFVNSKTPEERAVQEIPGLSKQYDQDFFKALKTEKGIVLENIVYYKDLTHYFVMTASKETLLRHKVIIEDNKTDRQGLLHPTNIDRDALEKFAIEVATISTRLKSKQLPATSFAEWKGKKDVSIFDFTNLYASSNACHIKERKGQLLLVAIVGDSLVQPFWPEGTGIGKAFLSVLDTAWAIKKFRQASQAPLELIREREMLYSQLKHTVDKDLRTRYKDYSINPATRYSLNNAPVQEDRILHLYDTDAK